MKRRNKMSKKSDIKLLEEIENILFSEMESLMPYTGRAFLTKDDETLHLFKGQYIALDRMRKKFENKRLRLMTKGLNNGSS